MRSVRTEQSANRFNVLLTDDHRRGDEHWSRQLPRLLEPQGVEAFMARSGREAIRVVSTVTIHAAVIDLAIPTERPDDDSLGERRSEIDWGDSDAAGGLWLLEVLRRVPNHPPVVVVDNRATSRDQAQRMLNHALRLGAFSVVNRPTELDDLLGVIRRLVDRRYQGQWPDNR